MASVSMSRLTAPVPYQRTVNAIGFSLYFVLQLAWAAMPGMLPALLEYMLELSLPAVVLLLWWFLLRGVFAFGYARLRHQAVNPAGQRAMHNGLYGLAPALLYALLLPWVTPALPSGSELAPYDRQAWLAEAATRSVRGDITPRQKMLADAIERLEGLSRDEVIALLGQPPELRWGRRNPDDLVYPLGLERDTFFGMDMESLRIHFDGRGIHAGHELITD